MHASRKNQTIVGLFILACIAGWFLGNPQDKETARVIEKHLDHKLISPTVAVPVANGSSEIQSPEAASTKPATKSGRPFEAFASEGQLLSQEVRAFEAQTWEPNLRKAFELQRGESLLRHTSIYRVDNFPYSLVRVDTVQQAGATTNQTLTETTTAPIWQNAMIADHVMVEVQAGVTSAKLKSALPPSYEIRRQISGSEVYLVAVPTVGDHAVESALQTLSRQVTIIKHVEPDFVSYGAAVEPNDPIYVGSVNGPQWHLPKVKAPVAWDVVKAPIAGTIGGAVKTANQIQATVVVAVLDTGVDYDHPDLLTNMWANPNEIAGNNQDDDNSGKKDDLRGWDFIGQSPVKNTIVEDNDPMDDVGHGTHVAGIIGAVGNNSQGVSGVCWKVSILPLRIIKKFGNVTYGTYSTALGAINYIKALNKNSRQVAVANHSWGGSGYSKLILDAINNSVPTLDPVPAGLKGTVPLKSNGLTKRALRTGQTITLEPIFHGLWTASGGCLLTPHPWSCMTKA